MHLGSCAFCSHRVICLHLKISLQYICTDWGHFVGYITCVYIISYISVQSFNVLLWHGVHYILYISSTNVRHNATWHVERSKDAVMALYQSLVRPHLESHIWLKISNYYQFYQTGRCVASSCKTDTGHRTVELWREIGISRTNPIRKILLKLSRVWRAIWCHTIYGLNWMKVVEEDMTRNCSRDYVDLAAENVFGNRVVDNWNSLSASLSILALSIRLKCTFCLIYELGSHKVLRLLL